MNDILSGLGISAFETTIAVIVAVLVIGIWIYNRKQGEEGRKIDIPTEALVLLVTVIGILVILTARSGIVNKEPILFVMSIFLVVTAISSFVDAYYTIQVRKDLKVVSTQFGAQMAGLGNLQFFPTKDETFKELVKQTNQATEKLIATRFSPADISVEGEYWDAMRQRAFDPKVLYIRIHSLAHTSSSCIDGVCRLISEFRGAQNFRLAVAFFNNSFEMIISDERECIFCFHDLQMTIRNGFRVDTNLPSSAKVVANFDSTLRRMLEKCYLVIDFGKYVKTIEDVENLQNHLRIMHKEFSQGSVPRSVHPSDMEDFIKSEVFKLN